MPNVRIAQIESMIEARTSNGETKPGYTKNVEALRAELARLQAIAADQDSGSLTPGSDLP
jgi:hypothetical protein